MEGRGTSLKKSWLKTMALIRSPSSFHFTNLDFRPDRKLLKSWFIKNRGTSE
jgi:hypothetical protein